MRFKKWWLIFLLFFLLAVVLFKLYGRQEVIEVWGKVERVVDGDTIEVEVGNKNEVVRLIGIDAPEQGECFASESARYLNELIKNKVVMLTRDESVDNRDKYGRLLRYVTHENQLLNVLMVKGGFAKEYYFMGREYKYRNKVVSAEGVAKKDNVGMWKLCD